MFLKKIIISGFKSFADKVVLTLDKGITGIVGPNGSGKSNVIDSVRWVMGEQNAKNLRGEKATDIIFAGSERRKALGMAEVSLIFDNTDDSAFCPPEYRHEPEITLTRRLYADGQREYLINRKPCRLKDIVNFFAMTGLGGRSYSMIQQGQVDRIVQASPEDMREIIEEAAGTMVYKKRKAEAQKKLEQTTSNLSRIDDILTEVEKQLGSLEGQVEKAKEWQTLSDKLREEEVSLFAHNYDHFRAEQKRIDESLAGESAKESELLAAESAFDARYVELRGLLDDSDPELQALQEAISVLREKIQSSEGTLRLARERIETGGKRLLAIEHEVQEDDSNLKVLEAQVDSARQEMANADQMAASLKEAIESFEYEVEAAGEAAQVYQGRIDEFEDEVKNVERLVESNKFRAGVAEQEIDKARAAALEERQRIQGLEAEIAQVKVDLEAAEVRAGGAKTGLDKEIREKHDREAAVAQRYGQMKDANQRRDALREKYHEQKARFTSLSELEAGATDVAGDLTRLRNEAPDAARAVLGLLTDFIAFADNAAELPPKAKAAFERWAERLVVQGMGPFNELVRGAARLGLGSLPVCVLSQCEAIEAAAAQSWAERCGAEPLRQYLNVGTGAEAAELAVTLDRLFFLPTLSLSDDELKGLPRGAVVFTAQGVTFAGHDEFVVGGKSVGGLLSRKTEMEALASNLGEIEASLGQAQAEIDDLEMRINQDRQVVADIDARLQQQNQGVLEVMSALQSVQQLHDRKLELLQTSQAALAKAEEAEARFRQDLETLNSNRQALERELANTRAELESVRSESEDLLERKEEMRRQHEGKRLEQAKSQARAQALRDSFQTTKAQLDLLQNKLLRRYEERGRLEQDVAKARLELTQAEQDLESFVVERGRIEGEYSSKREANAGVIEETRVIEGRLKAVRDELGKLQKGSVDKKMQLERVRMALEGVKQQAQEKYHLELEGFAFEKDPDFNHESRTRSVSRLRNKIEALGAINMMALKEFEEKGERRDFIAKQRDEVVSSMELLQSAILEIEETSLRKFMESFSQINEEFGQLFPILFPTGEAKLMMTTPDNPMEGGVEIMCRMPGKAIQPMRVRSGGEKALTAMALVFALLRTKPTPFCFLDEVDAPLDEANVGRYNRVLQALSDQFQFVVITHNRRTMEVLDTLYGVTMQEPGVSKVVGVDMQKDLPAHLRKAFKDEHKLPPSAASRPPRVVEGATAG
jgi:chromosome segregation protein